METVLDLVDIYETLVKGSNETVRKAMLAVSSNKEFSSFMRARRSTAVLRQYFQDDKSSSLEKRRLLLDLRARMMINRSLCQAMAPVTVDVALLLDLTAGMATCANTLSRSILSILLALLQDGRAVSVRFALVGYRDYDYHPKEQRLVIPFTSDIFAFRQVLQGLVAQGGNKDDADDVLGGLQLAGQLPWQGQVRKLIHMGSGPCHGLSFHDLKCSDCYPEGDPGGLEPLPLLRALQAQQVDYHFLRLCKRTDIMVDMFNEMMGERYVRQIVVKYTNVAANIVDIVNVGIQDTAFV